MKKAGIKRAAALALAVSLPLGMLCGCGRLSALAGRGGAVMRLTRAEGRVKVRDQRGESVKAEDGLDLFSGYEVSTRSDGFAWISLEEENLLKLDEDSEVSLKKEGEEINIELKSGGLLFQITEPLEDGGSVELSASSAAADIGGACGWAELSGGDMNIYLLEGKARCEAGGERETVRAGEMAAISEDGEITVSEFTAQDVPGFVLEESEDNRALRKAVEELPEPPEEQLPEATAAERALEQYRSIVGQASSYDYGSSDDATGIYYYTLVPLRADDEVPTLLLLEESLSGINCVRVFQYDPVSGTVRQPDQILNSGVASAGGYRGSIGLEGDGNGIQLTAWSSGTGQAYVERVVLEGDSLAFTTQWEGRIDLLPDELSGIGIEWYIVEDTYELDNWTPDSEAFISDSSSTPSGGQDALPSDGDRVVFRGTLNIYTDEELIYLQSIPETEAEWLLDGESYWIIVLDEPQAMALSHSGSPEGGLRSGEVSLIAVYDDSGELWRYAGEHHTFSIDPYNTWFPSDVSLPLGQPRTGDLRVLE